MLDAAIASLKEKDREAIVLRFYEGKNLLDVGEALGTSEDAAFQRVNRAVEKLRQFFTKRGVVYPAAILTAAISANSVQAAPIGLTASSVGAALQGAAITTSTLTATTATLKLMAWAKLKAALGIGAAVLLAGGAVTVAVLPSGPNAPDLLQQVQQKYASLSSYSETMKSSSETALPASSRTRGGKSTDTTSTKLARPNLYRLEELTRPNWMALWSVGDGNFWMMFNTNFYRTNNERTGTDLFYAVPTCVVPSAFFGKADRNPLMALAASTDLARKKDEKVGGFDCYTVSGSPRITDWPQFKMTLWIGKEDFLIHQVRSILSVTGSRIPYTNTVTQTHENISVNWPSSKEDFVHEMPAGVKVFDTFPGPENSK